MQYEKKQRGQNKDLVQAVRKLCLSATAARGNGSRRVRWDKAEETQESLLRAFFVPSRRRVLYAAALSERRLHQGPEAQRSLLG